MNSKIVKIKSWKELSHLITVHNPKSIVYNIEKSIPPGNLTGLRLILTVKGVQYIFIDTAENTRLRKTGILLRKDHLGNFFLDDKDIIDFVRSETKKIDIKFHSYWTI